MQSNCIIDVNTNAAQNSSAGADADADAASLLECLCNFMHRYQRLLKISQSSVHIGCMLTPRKTNGMRKLYLSRMKCSGQYDTFFIGAAHGKTA